ncbi:MAG: hypothetical protein ABIB79_02525 [archaeon]
MEIGYEGKITEDTFGKASKDLAKEIHLSINAGAVQLYWDKNEQAPIAKIRSSKMPRSDRKVVEYICLAYDFMIKKS